MGFDAAKNVSNGAANYICEFKIKGFNQRVNPNSTSTSAGILNPRPTVRV